MLAKKTRRLIEEAFADKKCDFCGAPATRLQMKKFLCHFCARATNVTTDFEPRIIKLKDLVG